MQLDGLTIGEDVLAELDTEAVAAVIAYRYRRLLAAGLTAFDALVLAARTDMSLESVISQHQEQGRTAA